MNLQAYVSFSLVHTSHHPPVQTDLHASWIATGHSQASRRLTEEHHLSRFEKSYMTPDLLL